MMNGVWKNLEIQGSNGLLEYLERDGMQPVFILKRRIRVFLSWYKGVFGVKPKDLWFLLPKLLTKPDM